MKRSALVILALTLAVCWMGPVATDAADNVTLTKKGSIKLVLYERVGGEGPHDPGRGDEVGWAVANANPNGQLVVQVHLDNGEPEIVLDVYVKINFPVDVYTPDGQLETNRQGKGNAHFSKDISEYSGDRINVQIVVKPQGTTTLIGYASAAQEVLLKRR
jgi:hypothetical protein